MIISVNESKIMYVVLYNLSFMYSLLLDLAFEMSIQTCQMIVNLVKHWWQLSMQVTPVKILMTSHKVDFLLKRTHWSREVPNMQIENKTKIK